MTPKNGNTGPIESRLPVLFEPDIESPWLPGLVIPETLVNLKGGASSRVGIQVENTAETQNRTVLGKFQLVEWVTPLEVRKKVDNGGSEDNAPLRDERPEKEERNGCMLDESPETSGPVPDVDLGDLTEYQKIVVMNMLRDEAESFSKDDENLGCLGGLNQPLSCPVQKNYTAKEKPSYPDVEQCVEDLVNRGWVRES